jgi:hypothetical protein
MRMVNDDVRSSAAIERRPKAITTEPLLFMSAMLTMRIS